MGLFPRRIETDRLRLERLAHETVDQFEYYEICSGDPGIEEVTRWLSWEPHRTVMETREHIDTAEKRWDDGEAATYLIRPRDSENGAGDIAGACTLDVNWERNLGKLSVWFRRRFWGRGYSAERAGALLALAFDWLDLRLAVIEHYAPNERSKQAVERYVDRYNGTQEGVFRQWIVDGDEIYDQHRYSITHEEYQQAVDAGDAQDVTFVQ